MSRDQTTAGFQQWLVDLNAVGEQERWAIEVYGSPITKATGDDCWKGYFKNGYTAAEALAEDLSYAD